MRYEFAPDLQLVAEEVSKEMFPHVDISRVKCFRSYGTSTKRTIARCHTVGKMMQMAIGIKPHYAIECISEQFDKLSYEEKVKVIIHELMHIPKTFGGGFRHHNYVTERNVNKMYKEYKKKKDSDGREGLKRWF